MFGTKQKAKYDIVLRTYKKTPNGKTNQWGHKSYDSKEVRSKTLNNTNFGELKRDVYNASKKDKNVYVAYGRDEYYIQRKPRRIKSVTKTFADGSKEVTYYKPVRKSR